ncbi:hypothetical protein HUO09_17795 [Vibrio sp. Y2-5]|uniref:hypothetical protein n=1 Tax=Vibrio sp. Y2-5 TaxID=2743977 RepID=UPI001660A222|nr:hypothetical protein [Vibrio sp. Y2-5]MBD0788212.1 hypothetical protein [Vibrio sp. Y2-5]
MMLVKNEPAVKQLKKNISKLSLAISLSFGFVFSVAPTTALADTTAGNSAKDDAILNNYFSAPLQSAGNVEVEPGFITLLGARVTGLDSCDGDIGLTITNAFTDGTVKKIYENFTQVLKSMLTSKGTAIYLAGLYLQKSNPGLYSLITNGINLGLKDFMRGLGSCEAMLNAASTYVPESVYDKGRNEYLDGILKNDDGSYSDLSQVDIVDFLSAEPNDEDNSLIAEMKKGVPWYNDNAEESTAGGENSAQRVLSFVKTGAGVAYCIIRGVSKDNCNAAGPYQEANTDGKDIVEDPMWELIFGTQKKQYMSQVMSVGRKIYGERYFTSCDSCDSASKPGIGLEQWYQIELQKVYNQIATRVDSNMNTITTKLIEEMSAPPMLMIGKPYISAIKSVSDRPKMQNILEVSLASEVAYYRTLYVGRLYIRLWDTMVDDKRTRDAEFQGEYKALSERAQRQLKQFLEMMKATGYEPGKYSRAILELSEANGNIDKIMNSLGRMDR